MELRSLPGKAKLQAGFTMVELLLVLFIVGLLAAIAIPNVSTALTRAREAALAENLSVMRRAIDAYHADKAAYPERLQSLVDDEYIQFVPSDPVAEEADWNVVIDIEVGGVRDIQSTSTDTGLNGVRYQEW